MYKIGFKFKVMNDNLIGEIFGVSAAGVYDVIFWDNKRVYMRADVHEDTISNNIKYGFYIPVN